MNNLINVLIVEDESAIRNLLSTALETNGYNYETATNGTELQAETGNKKIN